ncbi:glycosyltransferase [Pedobacter sp.]|uniref:glycosyltransferase n=1 Tax=Pedobacter sp. TaxID=1411316 RepID=UPI003D7F9CA0
MSLITKPLISIALCTYNGEKHLEKQLDSLVKQTYHPIEIVAVDDRSSDRTLDILYSYAEKYSFFKVIQNEENLGFVKNFEKAILQCSGDYIAMSDQDDIWLETKIDTLYNQMKDYTLVYHNSVFIDEHDNIIGEKNLYDHFGKYDGSSNIPFLIANCIPGHTTMFRRELVPHILPFHKEFYHDWWIAFVAITIGKIKAIPDILVKYRQHELSITDSLALKSSNNQKHNRSAEYNLKWITHCLSFKSLRNSKEIQLIYHQLSNYQNDKRDWRFVVFMVKYYKLIHHFTVRNKSYLSRLNRIRKICFR